MGLFRFLSAALVGFLTFAALYHLILWARARREGALLAFTITAGAGAVNTYAVLLIATSQTVLDAQRALDLRAQVVLLSVAALPWLFALVSDTRARPYLWTPRSCLR